MTSLKNDSLKSGVVAIIGRPNAGKSTLLNRLLGTSLSVVTAKAQTTRDQLLGVLTEEQGQILFLDSPGIHRARPGGLNEYMVHQAENALEETDLVWFLIDPRSEVKHEQAVLDILKKISSERRVFLILNKVDLKMRSSILDEIQRAIPNPTKKFLISAKTGRGVSELMKATWESLNVGPMLYPDPEVLSNRPVRYFVSEKIRKSLYLCLGEEIPYSCAVAIDRFEEGRSKDLTRIEATIHVERDSQKGVLIGQRGKKIKEIGTKARRDIEYFLRKKVYLGLNVRVEKNWTRNQAALEKLGYHQ